jgi:hypothetical protein
MPVILQASLGIGIDLVTCQLTADRLKARFTIRLSALSSFLERLSCFKRLSLGPNLDCVARLSCRPVTVMQFLPHYSETAVLRCGSDK